MMKPDANPGVDTVFDLRAEPLPPQMRRLFRDYPREIWEAHPGFREKTRNWLGAHQMFRRLAALVRSDTERFLDRTMDPEEFSDRLWRSGGRLVGNLHGHHGWEDYSYFPELSAADQRFEAGLEILEKDHETMNEVLDQFTRSANRVINLIQLDKTQPRREAGHLHDLSMTIEAFLDRHLSDEEELAVPIILHHRLRG